MSDSSNFLECEWDTRLHTVEDLNYGPSHRFPHTMEW